MSFSRWIYLMVSLYLLGLDPTAMMGLRHVLINTTIVYQKKKKWQTNQEYSS